MSWCVCTRATDICMCVYALVCAANEEWMGGVGGVCVCGCVCLRGWQCGIARTAHIVCFFSYWNGGVGYSLAPDASRL